MMHESNNNHDHLVLNKKMLSYTVSLLVMIGLLIFLVGYLFGKRAAMQQFLEVDEKNLFNDHLSYVFARMHNTPHALVNLPSKNIQPDPPSCEDKIMIDTCQQSKKSIEYQAQLMSFGTCNGAQELVNRLQRNGINTTIIKHKAMIPNASHETTPIHWYQVVTNRYSSQKELAVVVAGIKNIVNLHDVRIVKVE